MTATTSIRWTTAEAIQTAAQAHTSITDDTIVQLVYPGDEAGADAIWIDVQDITGEVSIPVMTAGRKVRDDRFELPFLIRTQGHATAALAADRASVLMAVLEDVVADDPGLSALDGLISAEVTEEKGPSPFVFAGGGFIAYARVVIACHARYL